jgi:hypothetical protein
MKSRRRIVLLDTITAGIFGLWNGGPSVGLPGSNPEPLMSALVKSGQRDRPVKGVLSVSR